MAGLAGLTHRARRLHRGARCTLGGLLAVAVVACASDGSMMEPAVTTTATSLAIATTVDASAATSVASTSDSTMPTMPTMPTMASVLLVGDSLAVEASGYLEGQLGASSAGITLTTIAVGGTAPCDFVDAELPFSDADIVVFSFNGNSFTDCTRDTSGTHRRGNDLVPLYRADLTTLVEQAGAAGADVVLVEQPSRRDDDATNLVIDAINRMIVEFAAASNGAVSVSPAGRSVEAPDGSFTLRLPCLVDEPGCAPDGSVVVRSDDGVHFCPGVGRWNGECLTYSPGARRFATAIATSIEARVAART